MSVRRQLMVFTHAPERAASAAAATVAVGARVGSAACCRLPCRLSSSRCPAAPLRCSRFGYGGDLAQN